MIPLLTAATNWLTSVLGNTFTVSSGVRTAAHNAAVGGVSNSYHLTGQALDLVPTAGQSMATLYNSVKTDLLSAGITPLELFNEGDHVHVAFGAGQSFGSGAVAGASNVAASSPSWFDQIFGQGAGDYIKNIDIGDGTQTNATRSPTVAEITGLVPDETGRADQFGGVQQWLTRGAYIAVALLLLAAGIFMLAKGNPTAIIEKVTS